MTKDNPYTYALTADPDKPLREAREKISRLTAERDEAMRMVSILAEWVQRLAGERDEAKLESLKSQLEYLKKGGR